MKKVMWFSRHEMTTEQKAALGEGVTVEQVNRTINSAFELKDEIESADIIAIVAPINLQQQFLKLAGTKPVIMAVNDRVLVKQDDGSEDKVEFRFVKWERLRKIEVIKEDWNPDQEEESTEQPETHCVTEGLWIIEYFDPCYCGDGFYSCGCDWDIRNDRENVPMGPIITYTDSQKEAYDKLTDKVDGIHFRWTKLTPSAVV